MALWISDRPLNQGSVFGMSSEYRGLGIFIDTYKNNNQKSGSRSVFPWVSLQPNDGTPNKYRKDLDGKDTEIGGCDMHRLYNVKKNAISKMKVTYLRRSNTLEVDFDIRGDGNWKNCYSTTNYLVGNIPNSPYIGVSAETGQLFHNVDLYEMTVSSLKDSTGEPLVSVEQLVQRIDSEIAKDEDELKKKDLDSETKDRVQRRRQRRLDRRSKRKTMSRLLGLEDL
ncbi:unnamed protein product [Ambrosiozyma monospora]|uniref:Unnamed protein product n=1 Tax=Ambrosiozyma monospora TaxID=43982 RepID=A0ACB5UCG8_AMBMO|nr:unnamed protein product [Ambrosiozyma monospora]